MIYEHKGDGRWANVWRKAWNVTNQLNARKEREKKLKKKEIEKDGESMIVNGRC